MQQSEASQLHKLVLAKEIVKANELVQGSEFFQSIIETGTVPREMGRGFSCVTVLADLATVLRLATGDKKHVKLAAEAYQRVLPYLQSRFYLTRPWNSPREPTADVVINAVNSHLFSLIVAGHPADALRAGHAFHTVMCSKLKASGDLVRVKETYLKSAFKARVTMEENGIVLERRLSTWTKLQTEAAAYVELVDTLTEDVWRRLEARLLHGLASLKCGNSREKEQVRQLLDKAKEGTYADKLRVYIEAYENLFMLFTR